MNLLRIIWIVILAGFVISGCSVKKDDVPTDPKKESRLDSAKTAFLASHIQSIIDEQDEKDTLIIEDDLIIARRFIRHIYSQNDFHPYWLSSSSVNSIVTAIKEIENDGLTPDDYHLSTFLDLQKELGDSTNLDLVTIAKLDVLLTDAMILIAFHLYFGKVDQHLIESNWNLEAKDLPNNTPEIIISRIKEGEIIEWIDEYRSRVPAYNEMLETLSRYRTIKQNGGWDSISNLTVKSIKPGQYNNAIPLVKERLRITGDYSQDASDTSTLYDRDLAKSVGIFQKRHNLQIDSAIGENVINAMNIPVELKIDQIRVNMERARWLPIEYPEKFIYVNIAEYEMYISDNNEIVYQTDVMVGKPFHQTPVFTARMKYIEYNPTWTVPASIAKKELLAKIQADPDYLDRMNMILFDRYGNEADHHDIDFSTFSEENFPYIIQQQSGPGNALGKVKFIFPNEYSVYFHDTPSKYLFNQTERAFSHGCIRVKDPLQLADFLLQDNKNWDSGQIKGVLESGEQTRFNLDEPIMVIIIYVTAYTGEKDGLAYFYEDVYVRDQAVLDELDEDIIHTKMYQKAVEKPFLEF